MWVDGGGLGLEDFGGGEEGLELGRWGVDCVIVKGWCME